MATEENDEAEQLRFLALKSMVKRSKPNTSKHKSDENDDQDILLLRAAALKTINTHKINSHNDLLVNKDTSPINDKLINEKKRNSQTSSQRSKKNIKLNHRIENEKKCDFINHGINETSQGDSQLVSKKELIDNLKIKPSENNSIANDKDDVKKIVRNGSIQLSNLDSEKVDETMVLHITFSSSEDSSSDFDAEDIILHRNAVRNSLKSNIRSPENIVDKHNKTEDLNKFEDIRPKMISYLQSLTDLMRHCESEIEKRNQQVTILLDAYKKYQNHSQSLCSILQTMKTIRDELSKFSSVETKTDH